MSTVKNNIHNAIRSKKLALDLVDAAKAIGLEEEKFSFKSLFMNKTFEGKTRSINTGYGQLVIGEKIVNDKSITYITLKNKNTDRTIEWDASDNDPVFTVKSNKDATSYQTRDASIFDSTLQKPIVYGLQLLKDEAWFNRELNDIGDYIHYYIESLEAEHQFLPIETPSTSSALIHRAYIKNDNAEKTGVEVFTEVRKSSTENTVIGQPLDFTYRVKIYNDAKKAIYEISVHGLSQNDTTEYKAHMNDLREVKMKIYQDDKTIEIAPEDIPQLAMDFGVVNTLNTSSQVVFNARKHGSFMPQNDSNMNAQRSEQTLAVASSDFNM